MKHKAVVVTLHAGGIELGETNVQVTFERITGSPYATFNHYHHPTETSLARLSKISKDEHYQTTFFVGKLTERLFVEIRPVEV
jgi:uncharacterized protein YdgA (DUF945 family)